jgi:predicted enzyme related to lactoylglutathione lyase
MALKLNHVTVDCHDPVRQATFWAEALGWDVAPGADADVAAIGGPRRPQGTPGWLFFAVPEPKTAKNRMHVDLRTPDLETEVRRLESLGATRVHEKREWDTHWFTLTDPEGNEFCVVEEAGA